MTDTVPAEHPGSARARLAAALKARTADTGTPLSYPQQRLWFLDQLQPHNAVYHIPLAYRVRGPLDVTALRRTIDEVARRHEILRTVYRADGGTPRQYVLDDLDVVFEHRDLRDRTAELDRIIAEESTAAFDLANEPPWRARLLRVSDDEHRLLLTVHHIACDAWSVGLLGRELSTLYAAHRGRFEADLPDLPIQYGDFAEWQQRQLTDAGLAGQLEYWREKLRGAAVPAAVPADHPRPPVRSFHGDHLTFKIPANLVVALEELARSRHATLFATFLAAAAVLLARHGDTDDVVVGTPVTGRGRAEVEGVIGFFANTLVLRVDTSGPVRFTELVDRAWQELRAAIAHQDLPFERLVEELSPDRDLSRNPLFDVLISYRDDEADALRLTGCEVTAEFGDTRTAKFDLTLSLARTGDSVTGRLEYNTDLYEPATIRLLAERFRTVLATVAAEPDCPVDELRILPDAELRRLLDEWAGTTRPDEFTPIHRQFEAAATARPDDVAVLGASDTLTFGELATAADHLAARLRALGVGPDVPVGVYLDRTPALVVALLGVLKAGGAYLPLDPRYPTERLSYMVTDSGAPLVVTRRALATRAASLGASTLTLESGAEGGTAAGLTAERTDSLAYVMYTSGSTGAPKAVMVSHGNLANFGTGVDDLLGEPAESPATWLAVTSYSFDISVLELLWTLARGHRVVLRPDPAVAVPVRGEAPVVAATAQARRVEFSLFYFGNDSERDAGDRYRLLLDGARFADRNGFSAVWTPERHFHRFGGLFPNPAVTGAALAAVTERVAIRAGSVVLPLHDPLRVAEEWAVVDNLSGGRTGVSIASGWQPNDFALAPERYRDRKRMMVDAIAELRALWRGETVRRCGGTGAEIDVRSFPRPVQPVLPMWLTSARSPETFQLAGELGLGLLTHLLGHSANQLADKITLYRNAWAGAGHEGQGQVTVMLHTFVGHDRQQVRDTVRRPLTEYLRTSIDLLAGLTQTLDRDVDLRSLPAEELDVLTAQAFDRFVGDAGLVGTPEEGADTVDRLKAIGVDEIACLIDFGVPAEAALAALPALAEVAERSEDRRRAAAADEPLTTLLRRHRVTHLQCTPALASALVEEPTAPAALGSLRLMLVGGEALGAELADRLGNLTGGPLHNMYGPTEATIWATTHRVAGGSPVTIGRPMRGVRAYVVDRRLRPAPIGVPGELLLGGSGVARGYLGRPGLTAARFVPDPFGAAPGARLYRTGDLVRWRTTGELEFLGRLDDQIKLHGHRIELGEIENLLNSHPGVGRAAAVVRGSAAAARIAAYVVAAPGEQALDTSALHALCARRLPDYMVPARFVVLDALPLTPNGKVDRKALPDAAATTAPRLAHAPPETRTEHGVAEVWRDVLRLSQIGTTDNFFELGGNSLLVLIVRARLTERLGVNLSVVDMFRHPTVAALAAAIDRDTANAPTSSPRVLAGAAAQRRRAGLARTARARRVRAAGDRNTE